MNLCSNGHDEVCYEGRSCPCCELKTELSSADDEIKRLQDSIDAIKESQ